MNRYSRLFKYIYYMFLLLLLVFIVISAIIIIPNFESRKNILLTVNLLLLWFLTSLFIINTLKATIKRRLLQFFMKKHLSSITFISSNCVAGELYRSLNLPYLSPFTDILFNKSVYSSFLKDIKFHLSQPVSFILKEKFSYPIFQLGMPDMEIHCMHSHSKEDAQNKWDRRKERMNYNKIITINAPEEYKDKFFRNIQLNNGSIEITKNNRTYTFPTREKNSDEEN